MELKTNFEFLLSKKTILLSFAVVWTIKPLKLSNSETG